MDSKANATLDHGERRPPLGVRAKNAYTAETIDNSAITVKTTNTALANRLACRSKP